MFENNDLENIPLAKMINCFLKRGIFPPFL